MFFFSVYLNKYQKIFKKHQVASDKPTLFPTLLLFSSVRYELESTLEMRLRIN